MTNDLSVSKHTKTVVKRAQPNLIPLRRLERFGMGALILKKFYSCTMESILTDCIAAWYGNCSALQRVVCTAQYLTGAKLPAIQDLYTRRVRGKPIKLSETSSPRSDCFLCYRTASSTGAPSPGLKGSLIASNPKP
jgi:hypothetical protein